MNSFNIYPGPQAIITGNFLELASPYISFDLPLYLCQKIDEINIENIINFRPQQFNFPNADTIKFILDKATEPKIIIVTSNVDKSFPTPNYQNLLFHPNLKAIITHNPSMIHPKIYGLPLGPKWQVKSIIPFGESKSKIKSIYLQHTSLDSMGAFELFKRERQSKIWIRPMTQRQCLSENYDRHYSNALSYDRNKIKKILDSNPSVVIDNMYISQEQYLTKLKEYRFVVSPSGNGLDSHSTWESLMCGCIPIVPSSPLNQIYEKLPVWVVENWEDITEEKIIAKEKELLEKVSSSDFELIFEKGLIKYINYISNEM